MVPMKAAILFESLTGNTRKAAELIATNLQQEGWGITGVSPVGKPELASIQQADLVVIGTWVHGLFVVGQMPFGVANLENLPAMRGKKAATYVTYGLNPGKSLAKVDDAVRKVGVEVVGSSAIHRRTLNAATEAFAADLVQKFAALK